MAVNATHPDYDDAAVDWSGSVDIDIDLGARVEDLRPRMAALVEAFVEAGYAVRVHDAPCDEPRALTVTRDGVKCDIAGFFKRGGARFTIRIPA